MSVSAPECGRCGGKGATNYRATVGEQRQIAPDVVIGPAEVWGTHLCSCRSKLEPREGEARWWTTEVVYHGHATSSIYEEGFEVDVEAEVPVSDDNYRVVRRGNRYYPTFVDIHIDFEDKTTLFPDEARALARVLNEAADAADAIDKPDVDACGHWWPCECDKATGPVAPDPASTPTVPSPHKEKDRSA